MSARMKSSNLKFFIILLVSIFNSVICQESKFSNATVEELVDYDDGKNELNPSTSPIEVYGNKFFTSYDGRQFFIKGIAYQPSSVSGNHFLMNMDGTKFIDPMAEPQICLRDLPYLKELGVNTVRVYSIDTEKNHDICFEAYAEAGIYVLADLSEPEISVIRETPSWDVVLYDRYTKVVDALHQYPNLLGFFAGNEVTNDKTNTDASPFVKSSIRDVKQYIKDKNYRKIPVGYSTNDDAETRQSIAEYFACGEVSADFYGINMYEWCGYSTYWASGYRDRTEEFKNYPVPVFFSEFGCNVKRPRPFTEVEALYSRLMTDVWSGGIAYMYFEEPNQYGVVEVRPDGEVAKLQDFNNLKEQFNNAKPYGLSLEDFKTKYIKASQESQCPSSSKLWKASESIPHTPDSLKCSCMERSLHCILSPYTKAQNLSEIFEYACGLADCSAIKASGENGLYGEFSDCNTIQKASYVLNQLFLDQSSDKQQCDFNGVATLNNRKASESDLKKIIISNGESCLNVLNNVALNKKLLNSKTSTSQRTNGSYSEGERTGKELASSAQCLFYSKLGNMALLLSVLVLTLVSFAA